jgi:hypothetical protein
MSAKGRNGQELIPAVHAVMDRAVLCPDRAASEPFCPHSNDYPSRSRGRGIAQWDGTRAYEVLAAVIRCAYNAVAVESQDSISMPDDSPDLAIPVPGDSTLIGSGARNWLLQRFAEIDIRFAPAPRESDD